MASELNDDVITETLLRLPAKALTKFNHLSKHWLSQISSAQFRHLHTLRHPKPPSSLLLQPRKTSDFFYLDLKDHKLIPYTFKNISNPKILSSCNGLMIVQSEEDYLVYNPTTHQFRRIIIPTDINTDDGCTEIAGLNLVFELSKSLHYKIVCVKRSPSSDQCRIEVCDSASQEWTQNSETFAVRADADFAGGVHCDGKVYWRISHHDGLYYDIGKNSVGNLPSVEIPTNGKPSVAWLGHFQEFNGRLHQFTTVGNDSISVYELEEDCSRWELKYKCEFREEFYNFGMLSLVAGDDGAARLLVDHSPGKITAYGFGDGRCEEVVDCSGQPFYKAKSDPQFDARGVHHFIESLASV